MTKLKRDFLIFHYMNPELWYWIDHYALQRARDGWEHYGIKGVVEMARWHTAIKTKGDQQFKIRNDFTAHYARMWMLKHPEYDGFFRTKFIPDDALPDCDDYGPPERMEKI